MKDILFVAHTANVSGAEGVLLDIVERTLHDGHHVRVACPAGDLSERLPRACEHVLLPQMGLSGQSGPARIRAAGRLVARWAAAGRILSRSCGPETRVVVNSLLALPAVRMARLPRGAAWLVHDTVVSSKQRAVIRFSRAAVRHAVAVSEATARPLRILGIETVVAYNGVRWPVAEFPAVDRRPITIGMLALLTPWKGHSVLLEAVAGLEDVRVQLAGGGFPGDAAYARELRTLASAPGLAGRVDFLGHVDPREVMQRWDIMVSASVEPEAGPLSVLEAMAHGLPVIGSDHGGTSEYLSHGAGVLVPPGDPAALADALRLLANDVQARENIGRMARERIADKHDGARTLPVLISALLDGDG